MHERRHKFSFVRYAVTGVLVVATLYVLFNPAQVRYAILDRYRRSNYTPSEQILTITEEIGLTDTGTSIFYATQPALVSKQNFTTHCPSSEHANVLGCYSNDLTYLLDVDEEALAAVEDVTAAHELLHGVWARLSESDQRRLAAELQAVYEGLDDQRLQELIASYEEGSPLSDDLYIPNELHSILGTEVDELSPALEQHYAQYFEDRQAVVALFHSYNDEFERRQARVETIQQELETLRAGIKRQNERIDRLSSQNDQLIDRINQLRSEGRTAESNQLVPEQNQLVALIRAQVAEVNRLIASYNQKVEENNDLALELNQLAESLDSRAQQTE